MQRLVLAIIILAVLVAGVAFLVTALRQTLARGDGVPAKPGGVSMIAYTLLMGLIVYVSFAGGG